MIDAIVTNLGALPGECVLSEGIPPLSGATLSTSKGDIEVRVAWTLPEGIFLSYAGPALEVGDTVTLP